MLTTLSPSAEQFLNNLNLISNNLQTAQDQISSGLKITQASDAPDSISPLLSALAALSNTEQTLTNLGNIKTETDAGEQTLETAVTLFNSVQTLGAEGATSTQTASTRQTLAAQLNSALQQMVGLANTAVNGRYIFAGDADQTVPYTYTAGGTPPVSAYQGTASTRMAEGPDGSTFPIALSGQQIFDSTDPSTNVFTAIQNLSAAMTANDTTAIQTAMNGLSQVSDYLNQQLASYGNIQVQVASATSLGQSMQTQQQTQISNLQDADMTSAILEQTQSTTQEEAALQSRAQIPLKTLFDYVG